MNTETKKGFDIYHSETVEKLSFKNRLNILFNGYIKSSSTITVDKEVVIINSSGVMITKDIFLKKELGHLEFIEPNQQF